MLKYILPPKKSKHVKVSWKAIGPTPKAHRKYAPQGMTFIDGDLVMAECWDDKQQFLYVIRTDGESYDVVKKIEMPSEAVHTGGLEWDGEFVWAVDYVSNKIYTIDWEKTLKSGVAVIVQECPTGHKGSGSLARLSLNDVDVVAVSYFMNSGRTFFVPIEDVFKSGTIEEKAVASYKNPVFVQGMMAYNGYLYEATNALGKDLIFKIDPHKAIEVGDYQAGIVARYCAPSKMIEDIAFDGKRWWTSDEYSYQIYMTEEID